MAWRWSTDFLLCVHGHEMWSENHATCSAKGNFPFPGGLHRALLVAINRSSLVAINRHDTLQSVRKSVVVIGCWEHARQKGGLSPAHWMTRQVWVSRVCYRSPSNYRGVQILMKWSLFYRFKCNFFFCMVWLMLF